MDRLKYLILASVSGGLLALASASPAFSGADEEGEAAFNKSQGAIGGQLPDIQLTATDGRRFRLGDLRGKPLVVALIYTSCASICPTLIETLAPALAAAREALGNESFNALTIGFDTRNDTPVRLKSFATTHGVDLGRWTFAAADAASLDDLARATGFGIYSRAGGFDHISQVSIIDAEGRLYQQVYGNTFEPPLLVEPLKNLVFHRDEPLQSWRQLINRVKFYCTVFDPASGRYYFNYSLFISIAIGLTSLGMVLVIFVREWRKMRNGSAEAGR